jgi:hypothetical protein
MTFDHKREKYAFIAAMVMIVVFVVIAFELVRMTF